MAWDIGKENGSILFHGYRIGGDTDFGRLLDMLRRLKGAMARSADEDRVGDLLSIWSELHMLMVDDSRWGGPTNGPYSEWLNDEWRDFLPSVLERGERAMSMTDAELADLLEKAVRHLDGTPTCRCRGQCLPDCPVRKAQEAARMLRCRVRRQSEWVGEAGVMRDDILSALDGFAERMRRRDAIMVVRDGDTPAD